MSLMKQFDATFREHIAAVAKEMAARKVSAANKRALDYARSFTQLCYGEED